MKVHKRVIFEISVRLYEGGNLVRKYSWWDDEPFRGERRIDVRLTSYEQGNVIIMDKIHDQEMPERKLLNTHLESEAISQISSWIEAEVKTWM